MTEEVEQNQSLSNGPHYNYVYAEDHHHCVHTARTHTEAYGQLKWVLAQERQYSAYLKDKVHKLEKEILQLSQNAVNAGNGGDKRPRRDVELEAANKQLKVTVATLRDEIQKLTLEKEKMVQDYQRYVKQLNQAYTAKLEKKEIGCRKLQERLQQLNQQLEQIHDHLPSNIALVLPLPLEDESGNITEELMQTQSNKPNQECLTAGNVKASSRCHRSQLTSSHNMRFSPPATHHADYQQVNGVTCTEKRISDSQLGTLSCTSSSTEIDSVSEHSLSPSKETTLLVQYLKSTPSKYGHLPSPAISETSSTDIPCHCNLSTKFSPCADFLPSAFTSVIRPKACLIKPNQKTSSAYTKQSGEQTLMASNYHDRRDAYHPQIHHGSMSTACCKSSCEPECRKNATENVPVHTQQQIQNVQVPKHPVTNIQAQNKIHTALYMEQNQNVSVHPVRELSKTLNTHKAMGSPTFITEERLKSAWTSSEENESILASPLPQNINELVGCSSTDSGLAESLDIVSSAAETDEHDPVTDHLQTAADDVISSEILDNDCLATCIMSNTFRNNTACSTSETDILSHSITAPINKVSSSSIRCYMDTPSPKPVVGNAVNEGDVLTEKQGHVTGFSAPEVSFNTSCTEIPHSTTNILQNMPNSLQVSFTKDAFSEGHANVSLPTEINLQQNEISVAARSIHVTVEKSMPVFNTCQSNHASILQNPSIEIGYVPANEKSTRLSPESTTHEKNAGRSNTPCSSIDNLSQSSRNSSPAVTTMPRMRARIKNGRNSTDSDASGDSPKINRHANVSSDNSMTDGAVQKTLEALGLGC